MPVNYIAPTNVTSWTPVPTSWVTSLVRATGVIRVVEGLTWSPELERPETTEYMKLASSVQALVSTLIFTAWWVNWYSVPGEYIDIQCLVSTLIFSAWWVHWYSVPGEYTDIQYQVRTLIFTTWWVHWCLVPVEYTDIQYLMSTPIFSTRWVHWYLILGKYPAFSTLWVQSSKVHQTSTQCTGPDEYSKPVFSSWRVLS